MDRTNAEKKAARARLLEELHKALVTVDVNNLGPDDVGRLPEEVDSIGQTFKEFEAVHVECLELHRDSTKARELIEEEFGRLHAAYIRWRETTEQWIAAHRKANPDDDDDHRSVTSRRSGSSRASNRSRRRAQIELQKLEEENRLQKQENEARLLAITKEREALKRKTELEIAALGDTDDDFEDENDPPRPQREALALENAPPQLGLVPLPPATKPSPPPQSNPSASNDVTSTSDATVLMAEAVTQIKHSVRRLDLPKIELLQFSGDCQGYMKFIRNFEACVDSKDITENEKLQFLIQNCTGEAKRCIEDCGLYGRDGYSKANEILRNRYGKPHKIARSFIDNLTCGAPLKPNDPKALTELSIEMAKCELNVSQLGFNSDINNSENIRKVAKRLPYPVRCKWTEHAYTISETGREPKFNDLTRFVERRAQVASSIYGEDLVREERAPPSKQRTPFPVRQAAFATESSVYTPRERKCYCCGGTCTKLELCAKFAALTDVNSRREIARTARVCYNCLNYGHRIKECRKPNICNVPECGRRHHYMLHTDAPPPPTVINSVQCNATNASKSLTYLGIIPVTIRGPNGKTLETNALIDNGAQQSFCHERVIETLDLPSKPVTYTVSTLTAEDEQHKGLEVDLTVCGINQSEHVHIKRVWSVKQLPISMTSAPKAADLTSFPHLRDVMIPATNSNEVLLLIGADSNVHVPLEIRRPDGPDSPYAERNVLGWVVRGPSGKTCHNVSVNFVHADTLDAKLERMWTTDFSEKVSSDLQQPSRDDKLAMQKIEKSCVYVDGHYEVALPWKTDEVLPNNEFMARSRLAQLRKKLEKDKELHAMYNKQMEDNIMKGFLEEEVDDRARQVWYLPHHAVSNPNKPGKVRVVFDGAAKFTGKSLNESLHQGPDLLNSLAGILMRFRQGRIALSADIEGMFNQVKVSPHDRDALRILWWPHGNLEVAPRHFRLTVQAFGLRSSPCIASYAVHKTASDNAHIYSQEAVTSAKTSFYVDDFLKSVDDVTSAARLASEMTSLMKTGGFNLTKWLSNSEEVLTQIPTEQRQPSITSVSLCDAPTQRALGIKWEVGNDCFTFTPNVDGNDSTKRGILSQTASLFDPLGLVAPVLLRARCILQQLCKLQLGWDDQIPQEVSVEWLKWKNSLAQLSGIQIPRCYFNEKPSSVELHVFSDASTMGYGACAYFRACSRGSINTSLIMGKSRVAPVKTVSVPRLELQAAVTATRLAAQIKRETELIITRTVYWTDSQVVLAYIRSTTRRFKTFVANRLTEIHEHTDVNEWRHVTSQNNVADLASRGVDAAEDDKLKVWLTGPEFLKLEEQQCQAEETTETDLSSADVYTLQVSDESHDAIDRLLCAHSSLQKLLESTAWLQRFTAYLYARAHKLEYAVRGPLTAAEVGEAERTVVQIAQRECFKDEYSSLQATKSVSRSSVIASLDPQLIGGMLCVGGRVQHSALSTEQKHPIILPSVHAVTSLIIRHYHIRNGHMGVAQVLASLQQKYWLVRGRKTVRGELSKCVTCKRFNGRAQTQIMAPLLEEQVTSDQPCFTSVGADYFGPFYVRIKRSTEKRYGCIFVCLASRAVHIEVAHSLSSDSLLAAIRRFESRRGAVKKIFSDNGTNFVGGNREHRQAISDWNQQQIQKDVRQRGIEWHFNAPHSSESGGIWERQIRTVRKVLCSITTEVTFTDEQLLTLMAEAERVVNNRPLSHVGDDSSAVITPNMLLTLKADTCLPPGVFTPDDHYTVRRYRQAQYLASVFWQRFVRHYLPSLQARQKWQRSSGNVRVGDVVLLIESTPRGLWPLARVTKVNTSRDGYTRSCEVFSRGSSFTRPISKIVLLEAAK